MSFCINPKCPRPDHPGNDHSRYCASCGSDLLLNGRYRVLRLLSDKTGFGKIYEAYEHTLPKILKVLKEDWNSSSKVVELFEQEARVLGKLEHPGIPKVDGYFQHPVSLQGWTTAPLVHCIVMEKVDGLNLDEWLVQQGNHPISQKQALRWLKQVVEVLDIVHANQYFHRDIKPGNIMLHRSGQLVLIDFGTARDITYTYMAKQQAGHKVTAIASAGFTPPEQANGHAVPQSDFSALGRSFVQLLTGKHPLEMYDPDNDEFRWRNHTANVSPLLLDLLDRMMARKVGDRPTDTQAILQQIAAIEKSTIQPSPRKFNVPIIAAISGLIVLGGTIGYWFKPSSSSVVDSPAPTSSTSSFPKPSDYANLTLANTLSGHSDSGREVAISPDGKTIVSGSNDKTIKVWNLETGELLRTLSGHSSWVYSVTISPDSRTIVSGGADNTIKVWNLETGELLRTLSGHSRGVGSVTISPDSRTIVSGSADDTIKVWNLETGELIRTLSGHSSQVWSVAINPNGRTIAGGGDNHTIKVWNLETGELLRTLSGHSDGVVSVAISPDSRTIVSGSNDKTIKVWNLEAGELLRTLSGHSGTFVSVAISPDSRTIVSGSADDTIKVWNLETGELIRTLSGDSDSVWGVAISPDGRSIVSSSQDKTIKVWRLE